jgi:hypothetical protein
LVHPSDLTLINQCRPATLGKSELEGDVAMVLPVATNALAYQGVA